jgi:hypothetical protein
MLWRFDHHGYGLYRMFGGCLQNVALHGLEEAWPPTTGGQLPANLRPYGTASRQAILIPKWKSLQRLR